MKSATRNAGQVIVGRDQWPLMRLDGTACVGMKTTWANHWRHEEYFARDLGLLGSNDVQSYYAFAVAMRSWLIDMTSLICRY